MSAFQEESAQTILRDYEEIYVDWKLFGLKKIHQCSLRTYKGPKLIEDLKSKKFYKKKIGMQMLFQVFCFSYFKFIL